MPLDEQAEDKGIGYGFNYKRQATGDVPLDEQAEDKGIGYGLNYKRQATGDVPLDEQGEDKGLGYGINYKRQATGQDMPLDERAEDKGLGYGINYKRQATGDVPLDEQAKDKGIGYKLRYRRKLLDQVESFNHGDEGLSYPLMYKRSPLQNNSRSATVSKSRLIYNQIYNNARKDGSKEPSQRRILETISGQNLGNLLVREWLELPLTNAERSFLAGWESEFVVRTAALGIYCIQGKATYAPISEIRDLLLMSSK